MVCLMSLVKLEKRDDGAKNKIPTSNDRFGNRRKPSKYNDLEKCG